MTHVCGAPAAGKVCWAPRVLPSRAQPCVPALHEAGTELPPGVVPNPGSGQYVRCL